MKCEEIKKKYNLQSDCCESCHEDDDMGYGEDLWFEIEGKDWHICCATYKAYESRLAKEANKISK